MMSTGIMKMGMMRRNDEGDDLRPAMIKSGMMHEDGDDKKMMRGMPRMGITMGMMRRNEEKGDDVTRAMIRIGMRGRGWYRWA